MYDINLGVLLMKRKFCPKLGPFFLSFVCPLVRSFRFFVSSFVRDLQPFDDQMLFFFIGEENWCT